MVSDFLLGTAELLFVFPTLEVWLYKPERFPIWLAFVASWGLAFVVLKLGLKLGREWKRDQALEERRTYLDRAEEIAEMVGWVLDVKPDERADRLGKLAMLLDLKREGTK